MRITIDLDPEAAAVVNGARLPDETDAQTINRLIRGEAQRRDQDADLPLLPGVLHRDISDVSTALASLDDRAS